MNPKKKEHKLYPTSFASIKIVVGILSTFSFLGLAFFFFVIKGLFLYTIIALAIALVSAIMVASGESTYETYADVARVLRIMGKSDRISVNDIAVACNINEHQARVKLHNIVSKKLLECAELDKDKDIFSIKRPDTQTSLELNNNYISEDGLKLILDNIAKCIEQIKEGNLEIQSEEVLRRFNHLEELAVEIFSHIQRTPDKLSDVARFMNYYLPVILELIDNFKNLENLTFRSESINKVVDEIETMVDVATDTLERIIDKLRSNTSFDIFSDIADIKKILTKDILFSTSTKDNKNVE